MHGFDEGRIRAELKGFIAKNFLFGADASRLTDSGSLLEGGFIDSTGVLELIAHLEASYGIKVDDEEMVPENLDSILNIAAFVGRKFEARPARP